nr:Chain B, Peptide from Methyl-coenzyme M reductase subunit alpha from Methanosarcina acetivorans [Methanosarcina acetivorans]
EMLPARRARGPNE